MRVQWLARQLVVTVNNKVFREFNPTSADAEAAVKLIRDDLAAVRWGVIGKSRPVVEYGLTAGANGGVQLLDRGGHEEYLTVIDPSTYFNISDFAWTPDSSGAVAKAGRRSASTGVNSASRKPVSEGKTAGKGDNWA